MPYFLRSFNGEWDKLQSLESGLEYLMIRMLIPVLDNGGAVEAARYAAFLFLERGVTEVELLEVLDPVDQGRAAAFHTRSSLMRQEKYAMLRRSSMRVPFSKKLACRTGGNGCLATVPRR
jgi:hypothetical protein